MESFSKYAKNNIQENANANYCLVHMWTKNFAYLNEKKKIQK